MFVRTVDQLVCECQRQFNTTVVIPWGWLFTQLLSLLSKYPSGITRAILLCELESSWLRIEKLHSKGTGGTNILRRIVISQQLSHEEVLEVFLREVRIVGGTNTKLGVVAESCGIGNHEPVFTMQMYLHKKLYDEEATIIAHNFKLRFTGCRLLKGHGNHWSIKLLPSDNCVILVDKDTSEKLFHLFPSLEGLEKCTKSQYIKSMKVKVIEIGKAKSLHYPNGQTMNQIVVSVVDDLGIHAKFTLWEDNLLMANLFEEDDILYIKNCFLVSDPDESYVLEYGPETVVYCCRAHGCEQQPVPSQSSMSKHLYILKDNKGRLDYSMYPERLAISEVKPNMTNMTLFGQVIQKEPIKLVKSTGVEVITYHMMVQDVTGSIKIMVREKLRGTTPIHVGQFLLMTNLCISESSSDSRLALTLDNERHQSLWNVSCIEGWLTSKCICTVSPVLNVLDCNSESYVVKGIVTNVISRNGQSTIVQTHCSCHSHLAPDVEGKLHCSRCNISGMAEIPQRAPGCMLFSLDSFWQWYYNITIIITDSAGHSISADMTNEAAEKLLHMTAREFYSLEESAKQRVLECTLGQECCFGMSNYRNEFLIGVVCPV